MPEHATDALESGTNFCTWRHTTVRVQHFGTIKCLSALLNDIDRKFITLISVFIHAQKIGSFQYKYINYGIDCSKYEAVHEFETIRKSCHFRKYRL